LVEKVGNWGGCVSCEGGKDEYSDEDIGLSIEYGGIDRDI
jgi:hypothetical protein